MIESTITICNKAGLHARAAAKLVAVVSKHNSKVSIGREKLIDAHSILSLMMLAAGKGSELTIVVEGDDETTAFAEIVALVNNRFEESE
jgi:phosphocarrier protein HPr